LFQQEKEKKIEPKTMFLRGSSTFFLLGSFGAVSAVKDDTYYRAGMGNPNTDYRMFWADARNVLEDLDQFSSLYVQYHNCAWSQMKDGQEEQQSGSGDETDYWYIGATPSYGANVAFSLYGSLDGEKFSGCNQDTFINSFTTNTGFEAFASSIYYAGSTSTDYSQSYSSECQGGSGVVCDYSYGFGYATFSTNTCDPAYATSVTDSMSYMNQDFQAAQCVQIYDGSSSSNNNNNNRDLKDGKNYESEKNDAEKSDSDRNLQNNYGYGYNGYNTYDEYGYSNYINNYYNYQNSALALLYNSNSCFVQNYWAIDGGCPDPYGLLQEYQANFNKGVRLSMKIDTYATYQANLEVGKRYVKVGAFLFFAALMMFLAEQMMAFKAKKRLRGVDTGPSPSTPKSIVALVNSTSTKVKKSAKLGVKKAVAKITKSSKTKASGSKDGVMVET